MKLNWLPWKWILQKVSRAHNFVDPILLLHQFNRFAKPSEVLAPVELLRTSAVFQARALLNSQAIQHNLDWIWPYWVQEQFDPRSPSFLPRAFSVTHMNLTHRNWTALGWPGCEELPLVDPRGLTTPFFDGWSLDFWFIPDTGPPLYPSRNKDSSQELTYRGNPALHSVHRNQQTTLKETVSVEHDEHEIYCRITVSVDTQSDGTLICAVRPFNPEGVSFIHAITTEEENRRWRINKSENIDFASTPDAILLSNYANGDFRTSMDIPPRKSTKTGEQISCPVGMANGGALYRVSPPGRSITVRVPYHTAKKTQIPGDSPDKIWNTALADTCTFSGVENDFIRLFDISKRTILLHYQSTIYAGPFTYKHYWIRDAALIGHAFLRMGMIDQAVGICRLFFEHQTPFGYFQSQNGEWDSNGQVLWFITETARVAGKEILSEWHKDMIRGGKWIIKKRNPQDRKDPLTAGILPAGFSAEHLGPNDNYYWDNFWAVAGLFSLSKALEMIDMEKDARRFHTAGEELRDATEKSLAQVKGKTHTTAMPASPHRRPDSGSVGSLAASYPLQVFSPDDPRITATTDFLFHNCMVDDTLFHDISHSGINPYLTLHTAQAMLRAGDRRFERLVRGIARIASPTGQWPEAIHPTLKTGCMGDGQHVWAAAEWLCMIQHMFIREEQHENRIIFCSGVFPAWLEGSPNISFGPVSTQWGAVSVQIFRQNDDLIVQWDGLREDSPPAEISLSGKRYTPTGRSSLLVHNYYTTP
ncbi:MAG: hypothetical protein ACQEQV_07660 [Fibrobacterota bacterium]